MDPVAGTPLADGPRRHRRGQQTIAASSLAGRYSEAVDRDSAYERLTARMQAPPPAPDPVPAGPPEPPGAPREQAPRRRSSRREQDPPLVTQILESDAFRSALRSAGTALGRTIFGTRRR